MWFSAGGYQTLDSGIWLDFGELDQLEEEMVFPQEGAPVPVGSVPSASLAERRVGSLLFVWDLLI